MLGARHRDVRHFLNLCATAPLRRLFSYYFRAMVLAAPRHLILAPPRHILGDKIRAIKNCDTEPYISKILAHNYFTLKSISTFTSPVSLLLSPMSCLLSPISYLPCPVSCLLSLVSCLKPPFSHSFLLSHISFSCLLTPYSCLPYPVS